MSGIILAAAAAVLVAVVIGVVAWPFVSPAAEPPEQALAEPDRHRLELLERRDAAYQALRDLDHDHRTGKLTDADYEAERTALRAEAAAALRELDSATLDAVHKED